MNFSKKCVIVMMAGMGMVLFGKNDEPVICKTCNDTGNVAVECPVCKGSKYVWQCIPGKNRRYSSSFVRRFDEDGNPIANQTDDSWCGYGATYKALHVNCKNSKKRIPCPNCQYKGKASSSGKITRPCPDCDGQGTPTKIYYLIRDEREVAMNREYICRQFERGESPYVIQRKMTKDDLADFKIENTWCKVFEKREEVIDFIKRGEENNPDAKWYFVIRDTNQITLSDKRNALESTLTSNPYGYSNVFRRKLTDEMVKDFRALNPNGKLFRDVSEFKDFVRNAKTASAEQHSWGNTIERSDENVIGQVFAQTNADGRVYRRRVYRRTARPIRTDDESSVPSDSQQLSPEQLKKITEAEEEHDREMFQRKFGKGSQITH